MSLTLFDKIWARHVITHFDDGNDLLFIDRHLLHEVTSPQAFSGLLEQQRGMPFPQLTVSTEDHVVSTAPERSGASFAQGQQLLEHARINTRHFGVRHFPVDHARQGIVHVMAPEQGLVLPGMTAVCGDSHTCTLGALGCVAFGIGTSEVEHVMATQSLVQKKPANLRVVLEGALAPGVYAKDVILKLCQLLTVSGATGHAIEFAGAFVRQLPMDGRFTLCNMAIEMGARIGLIAPDGITFEYVRTALGRPAGDAALAAALAQWSALSSDAGAHFERELLLDVSDLQPQITWGTNPDQVIDIGAAIGADDSARAGVAFDYMGLQAGERLLARPVDVVFIGSCTNGRLSDLRVVAELARGRQVAPGVRAFVVPGSQQVRRAAEREGLDAILSAAGFRWGQPGCSMCASVNQEFVGAGQRCLSTSNRNFIGRQGAGARTHLVSPAVAAASALTGKVTDPRQLGPLGRVAAWAVLLLALGGNAPEATAAEAAPPSVGRVQLAYLDGGVVRASQSHFVAWPSQLFLLEAFDYNYKLGRHALETARLQVFVGGPVPLREAPQLLGWVARLDYLKLGAPAGGALGHLADARLGAQLTLHRIAPWSAWFKRHQAELFVQVFPLHGNEDFGRYDTFTRFSKRFTPQLVARGVVRSYHFSGLAVVTAEMDMIYELSRRQDMYVRLGKSSRDYAGLADKSALLGIGSRINF